MADRSPSFASRTGWNLELNRLARLVENRRSLGRPVLDLTESNPTRCGFDYPGPEILEAVSDRRTLIYDPHPRGLPEARQAVADYYADRNVKIDPQQVLLTSGSSDAYGHLFRLLAAPGDNVLVPHPSYPLFEFLSRINDVELVGYALEHHQRWEIDFESLASAVTDRTRAVIAVSPNNPTGSVVLAEERRKLVKFCRRHGLALIADEVFLDYCFPQSAAAGSFAGTREALTFALNGLSKTAALPQLKLGWIVVNGPADVVEDALGRLEVIADTYLSVGTAVQWALPRLLAGRHAIQRQIAERVTANLRRLDETLAAQTSCSRLEVEGGWSVVLRLPRVETSEDWAVLLLEHDGILTHPGHFFDFQEEGYLVLSLIVRPEVFQEGIARLVHRVRQRCADGSVERTL